MAGRVRERAAGGRMRVCVWGGWGDRGDGWIEGGGRDIPELWRKPATRESVRAVVVKGGGESRQQMCVCVVMVVGRC